MDRIPPEIWCNIFSPICTDGGAMARSLSLVSREFYDASRSLRLQSVRCDGVDMIIRFASVLDRTPPPLQVVCHLFVDSYYIKKPSPSLFQSVTAMLSLRRKADETIECLRTEQGHASLLRILTIIAPNLRTLALRIELIWLPLPFPPSLPALVELSIQHTFFGRRLNHSVFHWIKSASSLRRLTLTGFLLITDPIKVIESITRFAPSLTHLGIPAEPANTTLMVYLLAAAIARSEIQSETVFPGTLESLVIEDSPMGDPPSRIIASGNRRIILAHRSNARLADPGEMRLHWEARMNGRDGYWRTDENVEYSVGQLDAEYLDHQIRQTRLIDD